MEGRRGGAIGTHPTPDNGWAIVSVPVDGFAWQLGRLAQFLYVNRLWGDAENGRTEHNYANDGRGSVGAEVVVGRAGVAAGIVLVHLGEEQAAVHLVEDAGHIVRVEQQAVLLPAQVLQRRIGTEMAVEHGGLAKGQVNLGRCINHLGLICPRELRLYYWARILFPVLTLNVEKGLGRLQFALVAAHLALVFAQVAHHGRIDAEAAVGAGEGAPHQILHLLQQDSVLVPGRLRAVRILHDAVKERRLALHDGLVDGRDFDQGTALHCQMVSGAVVPYTGCPVREDDLAVIPALVGFTYGSQIDGRLAQVVRMADQMQSPNKQLICRCLVLVPGEDLLVLLRDRQKQVWDT